MSQLFNFAFTPWIVIMLISLALAKFIWSLMILILPTSSFWTPLEENSDFFTDSIYLGDKFSTTKSDTKVNTVSIKLKDIKIKAIFKKPNNSFILINQNGRLKYLYIQEKYRGYKLLEVAKNYAIFEKEDKQYKVMLDGYKQERDKGR